MLVASILGLTAVVVPAASARIPPVQDRPPTYEAFATSGDADTGGYTTQGGCFFASVNDQTLTNSNDQGVIGVAALTRDPAGGTNDAVVDCYLQVNFSIDWGTYQSTLGFEGLEVNVAQIGFNTQGGTLPFQLCEQVTYNFGTGPTATTCTSPIVVQTPPQAALDLLDSLLFQVIDPTVCPLFVTAGQNVWTSVLQFGWDGDVYVVSPLGLSAPVYDCPPYGNY